MTEQNSEQIVNKRLVLPAINYLDDKFGPAITDRVLKDIGFDRLFFDDVNGFMPLSTTDQLFNAAMRITNDSTIPYYVGKNLIEYLPRMQAVFLAMFATPALVFQNMGKTEQNLVKTTVVKTERLARNKFRLSVSFKDGHREPATACQNRIGTYEMIPRIFGMPYADVNHTRCAFRGDPYCVYEVTIPDSPHFLLRRLTLVAAIALGIASIPLYLNHEIMYSIAALIGCNVNILMQAFFARAQVKKMAEWGKLANQALQERNLELDEDNRRTEFLHELSIELNRNLDPVKICERTSDALVNDYHYGSCQVWLVNDKDELCCPVSVGYSEKTASVIKSIAYSIEDGMKHHGSFIYDVIGKKETLLINDVANTSSKLSEITRDFINLLEPSSAILVPLFEKDRAIGMLVGVHHDGKKVSYTDKMLFEATAPVVSNSLVKALLYERMEKKISDRSDEIARQEKELMTAREMAIQSEKLSAIGQMAAAVAHEINNPLNFLLNIMPDLQKDIIGLSKYMDLGQAQNSDIDLKVKMDAICSDYTLAEHLKETTYIFDSIKKSLDKAKKVTNSLTVFARTSYNDPLRNVNVKELFAEATELIPQKYKQNMEFAISVPSAVYLNVNKIEIVQVMLSIIQNSIEATTESGIIEISAVLSPQSFLISIKDHGEGIPLEIQKKVFRPFFTTKKNEQHLGLGLTVAREILKKYGATIAIDSTPGNGATVLITFTNSFGILTGEPHVSTNQTV